MTYDETLSYLYQSAPLFQQIGKGAYKEGLETTFTLDTYFAHPHRSFQTIHVAGTNGKVPVRTRWPPSCKAPVTKQGCTLLPISSTSVNEYA